MRFHCGLEQPHTRHHSNDPKTKRALLVCGGWPAKSAIDRIIALVEEDLPSEVIVSALVKDDIDTDLQHVQVLADIFRSRE